ncbi:MAG: anaerobic C4-dicarboxylate transporter [Burkholderiales bacterium]|nr:anaerobic C4-dicarboxylate transporter [Burkholderiales bacterium]
MYFWFQLILLVVVLFFGAKKGSIYLGLIGGVGLIIFVFGPKPWLGITPGTPPVDVILTIIAVVAAGATLQASGGLDCLLQVAERILRNHPRFVTYLAPLCSFTLTILCGTGHTVYTLLPIVYDVAIKRGVRPERPMAATSIAAQMGIICSPVSVACVTAVSYLSEYQVANGTTIGLVQLLALTIPSGLVGLLLMATWSNWRGKDLDKDPDFQALIADPESRKYVYGETATLLGKKLPKKQWTALWIFLGAIAIVAILGAFSGLRPLVKGKPLSLTLTIQMFMLAGAAVIVMATNTPPKAIGSSSVFRAGMVAVVSVFGVAWMSDSVFTFHLDELKSALVEEVKIYPWLYAFVIWIVSKFLNSQGAAVAVIVPVALQIGTPPGIVAGLISACYGYYILPTYPSDLASIEFDRSGTTKIGKYVINHSFIIPGLIGVWTATGVGYVLALMYGWI